MLTYNPNGEVMNTSLLNKKYGTGECPDRMVNANETEKSSILLLGKKGLKMDQIQALLKKENSLKKIHSLSSSYGELSNGNLSYYKHGDGTIKTRQIYVPQTCSYDDQTVDQRDQRCVFEEENMDEEQIQDYESDAIYRFRMSSWSYRIVDYFGVSREIVSIAFNYLDRFIDSGVYCCKSTYSYKLASITALHIALKVHNRTTIKATTLADLSKGEISATDIIHMETIMLKALDYHLCPPTCQTFIVLFAELLPVSVLESSIVSHIIQQAMYIAELSTMHLLMKGVKASVVSVGAMWKVMDMMVDENALNGHDRAYFLKRLGAVFKLDQSSNEPVPSEDCYWWKEVQCCRVLLDEIISLNCRQAMDGSDQILSCNNLYFQASTNHQHDCYTMNEKFGIQEYQHIISSSDSTESSSINCTNEQRDDQEESPREIF
ncbi:hypothetical protein CTEN210_12463 [Chaetoceros tenuissimus]|uniref:Cyclin-like domain-containing protein n=1 Tax=Chaetoceros tenuissimus TaxID=426638 RepID=A0AAD3D1P7_9STRA|nr:hypothetical protein CTEN210_12463 [Chaetoceros tenuissimus]